MVEDLTPTTEKLQETLSYLSSLAEGHSLLYVEDEDSIRDELVEIFSMIFERVVACMNGEEALAQYKREKFSILITDINMPHMNGVDLIRNIQLINPKQNIIVTSAHSESQFLLPLINMGVGTFILKPVGLKNIFNAIQKELIQLDAQSAESRYQKRLEKEILLRTTELQEAMAQIIKLQESKENMLALISHELRTPLNGLLGFTDLVRSQVKAPELVSYLEMIQQSARRLDRSTKKALDFIRISTGGRVLHKKVFPVKTLVQAALQELAARAMDYQCEVTSHVDSSAVICTDSELALDALKNVLENALKYACHDEDMRPEVVFGHEDSWEVLTVRDFGSGFTAQALEQAFQPFNSGNLMNHSEGLGLGLALTDVIMLTLGGKVKMSNHPDGGARVSLYFPRS